MASLLQFSQPKHRMHFFHPPYKARALPISSSLTWPPEQSLARGKNHEAPHCAVFSSLVLLPPKHFPLIYTLENRDRTSFTLV